MDTDTWVLVMPFTAPLTLNQRMHHMARARKTKEYREAACWLARAGRVPACGKIRTTLVYTPPDRRRRDEVNLVPTLKALEDGLVDAGVVPDDTPVYVESQMPLLDTASKVPSLVLYVERLR